MEFFGGMPRRLIFDNLDPAGPRHATEKPKVERGILYVRQSFFRGEHCLDSADAAPARLPRQDERH